VAWAQIQLISIERLSFWASGIGHWALSIDVPRFEACQTDTQIEDAGCADMDSPLGPINLGTGTLALHTRPL